MKQTIKNLLSISFITTQSCSTQTVIPSGPRLLLLPLFVLPLGLVACHKKPTAATPVQTVYVTQVSHSTDTDQQRSFSAVIASDSEASLGFKTAGRVSQKLVDVGQAVGAGQVLYRMEPDDYSQSYQAAENQWKAAQIDARQQQIEADRLARLLKDGSVAKADWERQQARAQAAAASRDSLRSQVDISRNRVNDTTIKAPFSGVITRTLAEVGQVVSSGQPIVVVARTNQLEAVVNIPEQMVQNLSSWQASLSNWKDGSSTPLKLKEVAGAANPYSRTYETKYNGIPAGYKLGMTAKLVLTRQKAPTQDTFNIPSTSIVKRDKSPYVWVLQSDQHHVKPQVVNVVAYNDEQVEVTGLQPGQVIVSLGAYKVNGQAPVNAIKQQSM